MTLLINNISMGSGIQKDSKTRLGKTQVGFIQPHNNVKSIIMCRSEYWQETRADKDLGIPQRMPKRLCG